MDVQDLFSRMNGKQIQEALYCLSDREADIIRLHLGFGGEEPQSLEEVARKFGITRKKVRQIEAAVFKKLSHPGRYGSLL